MNSQIRITRDPVFDGTISPFIYGEFVEFLNDLIPGMWAERIRDRSFEGLSQPTMFYRKEKDFPGPAWREMRLLNTAYGLGSPFDVLFDRVFGQEASLFVEACLRVLLRFRPFCHRLSFFAIGPVYFAGLSDGQQSGTVAGEAVRRLPPVVRSGPIPAGSWSNSGPIPVYPSTGIE